MDEETEGLRRALILHSCLHQETELLQVSVRVTTPIRSLLMVKSCPFSLTTPDFIRMLIHIPFLLPITSTISAQIYDLPAVL